MAKQAVVLFGAGASIDAGLPSAFGLTKAVYHKLLENRSDDARMFATIVAKLQLRAARQGASPYADINIEDVYEALKKFISRDRDILAEFVTSWDDPNIGGRAEFDADRFFKSIAQSFQLRRDRRLDGGSSFHVNEANLANATEVLQKAFGGEFYKLQNASLEPFLLTLSSLLQVNDGNINYMREFLGKASERISCIATLNYDRVVERACELNEKKFDLGISQWNEKRYVRYHGQSIKLIKLHGSVDWYVSNEDEILIQSADAIPLLPRAMVFGGQDSKLVPHGPFLHLRHEFQRFLAAENRLLVAGYSFGDAHLNAIIRSWVATRQNAKMMVVDPNGFDRNHPVMVYAKDRRSPSSSKKSVELEVVAKKLSDARGDIFSFLEN